VPPCCVLLELLDAPCCGVLELLAPGEALLLALPLVPLDERLLPELPDEDGLLLALELPLVPPDDRLLPELPDDEGLLLALELPLVPLLLPDAPLPDTPSAASVCWSRLPEAWMPCCCWNWFRACFVFGPSLPSTGPGSMPFSVSFCCTSRTCEESAELEPLPEALALALPLPEDALSLDAPDDPLPDLPDEASLEGEALAEPIEEPLEGELADDPVDEPLAPSEEPEVPDWPCCDCELPCCAEEPCVELSLDVELWAKAAPAASASEKAVTAIFWIFIIRFLSWFRTGEMQRAPSRPRPGNAARTVPRGAAPWRGLRDEGVTGRRLPV